MDAERLTPVTLRRGRVQSVVALVCAIALVAAGGVRPAEASLSSIPVCDKNTIKDARPPVDPKDHSKNKEGHLGDGDGDGRQNDVLLREDRLKNTIEQAWCIDDQVSGPYYALLVDGRKGHEFAFVGKCSWPFGQNDVDDRTGPGSVLKEVIWKSTDADGKKYRGTGEAWKYTYDFERDTVTWVKVDRNGRILKGPQTISPAPKRPFTYGQLPGGKDPTRCKVRRH